MDVRMMDGCFHKKVLYDPINIDLSLDKYFVFESCPRNELVGLQMRHLVHLDDPVVLPEVRASFMSLAKQIRRMMGQPTVKDKVKIVNSYTGGKKKVYERALKELDDYGLDHRDTQISAFVKIDKMLFEGKSKPRIIQARSPKFNLEIGQFIKPIEKLVYRYKHRKFGRVCAKTLNPYQRAEILREKWEKKRNPVAIMLDFSSFDAHVHELLLRLQHKAYGVINPSKDFKKLLKFMINNHGVTRGGIKYRCIGRRMSGDSDTASGNCFIVISLMNMLGEDYISDGDDVVFVVEQSDLDSFFVRLNNLLNGLKMPVTMSVAHEFGQIRFCQSGPVKLGTGWKMCRDPLKVLATATRSNKYHHTPVQSRRYLRVVFDLMKQVHADEPVVYDFACRGASLMSEWDGKGVDVERDLYYYTVAGAARSVGYSEQDKFEYGYTFSVDVDRLLDAVSKFTINRSFVKVARFFDFPHGLEEIC